jgi:hypothetical protein
MMKQTVKFFIALSLTLSYSVLAKPMIDLYKSPSCGCCTEWAAIMKEKGYQITTHHQKDWTAVKRQFGMPGELLSCHTAVIDGYMVEGHVPEADIARLLKERPAHISGISVPGMPQHSPGMVAEGQAYKGFNVVAFDKKGQQSIYTKY